MHPCEPPGGNLQPVQVVGPTSRNLDLPGTGLELQGCSRRSTRAGADVPGAGLVVGVHPHSLVRAAARPVLPCPARVRCGRQYRVPDLLAPLGCSSDRRRNAAVAAT